MNKKLVKRDIVSIYQWVKKKNIKLKKLIIYDSGILYKE